MRGEVQEMMKNIFATIELAQRSYFWNLIAELNYDFNISIFLIVLSGLKLKRLLKSWIEIHENIIASLTVFIDLEKD